jgi:pimeloyl-ACP methyl ester carboxylesterase
MRNRFDSVSVAPSVRCPTVIVHSDKDAMIGPHHPTALAAAFPTPPTLIWVRGRSHNDPLLTDAKAWEAVRALAR